MGQVMTLLQVVEHLHAFDKGLTIYAEEPWTADSMAMVELEPEDDDLPVAVKSNGLKYFLEVFIANEFVTDWLENFDGRPSHLEVCNRLIEYAVNDA